MGRIIIVSNRIPVRLEKHRKEIFIRSSEGGLATGLSAIHSQDENLWVGWHGLPEEDIPSTKVKDELLEKIIRKNCIPVSLSRREIREYYDGYSNNAIWPVFHYFTEYAQFNKNEWETYCEVNKKFAGEILQYVKPDDTIWIHDYHLMLMPALLKKAQPDLKIGFFLHIPFPSFEVFRIIPNREEILEGLLGADLIGFHTEDYQQYFLESVNRLTKAKINCDSIEFNNHSSKTAAFPMGIDFEKFYATAKVLEKQKKKMHTSFQKEFSRFIKDYPERKTVLSIDRLDYTKGIAQRIRAFNFFLEKYPEYREKVQLVMLAVPSRTGVEQYQLLKKEIDELVGRINSKYATPEWSPILYLFRSLDFENLVQLYAGCDVALLTPVRDGMNLVAKEYLASRTDGTGVLILSEMTGASNRLSEALLINPNNFEQIGKALKQAFEMTEAEQKQRNHSMQEKLKSNTVFDWAEDFLDELEKNSSDESRPQTVDTAILKNILNRFQNAQRRLMFIDYDGTLVGFKNDPEEAVPSAKIMEVLKNLNKDEKNDVYLVSGRGREFLEKHFGNLGINLVAEHGVYSKNGYLKWKTFPGLDTSWMERVEDLLQKFVEETPGAFIEKKSFSLAWHYRKASETGEENSRKLYQILSRWARDMNLAVLNGNKVIEITNPSINKGIAIKDRANCGKFGFIMAIGDDHTDEFMFSALPACALTVKVGSGNSIAKFRLDDRKQVYSLLSELKDVKKNKEKEEKEEAVPRMSLARNIWGFIKM